MKLTASLVIGMVGGALATYLLGSTLTQYSLLALAERTILEKPVAENTDKFPGRYQIVFGPYARADVYLLDTSTGKIWNRLTHTFLVGDPDIWRYMDRADDALELMGLRPRHYVVV